MDIFAGQCPTRTCTDACYLTSNFLAESFGLITDAQCKCFTLIYLLDSIRHIISLVDTSYNPWIWVCLLDIVRHMHIYMYRRMLPDIYFSCRITDAQCKCSTLIHFMIA